ncbi:hypothetical protein A5637_08510 [Mycolicibacterium fortuitum]|nr:hypothetical protein A5666_18425 [Mycolicibacterium fortuitum]OBK05669.1 hypothetical protein A5637_08510 [Mycolicibacterium fortuitum]
MPETTLLTWGVERLILFIRFVSLHSGGSLWELVSRGMPDLPRLVSLYRLRERMGGLSILSSF